MVPMEIFISFFFWVGIRVHIFIVDLFFTGFFSMCFAKIWNIMTFKSLQIQNMYTFPAQTQQMVVNLNRLFGKFVASFQLQMHILIIFCVFDFLAWFGHKIETSISRIVLQAAVEILHGFPATQNKHFGRIDILVGAMEVRKRIHDITGSIQRFFFDFFDFYIFPFCVFVLQIQDLTGFVYRCVVGIVDGLSKSLKHVHIFFIWTDIQPRITPLFVHIRHLWPFLVVDVVFFAVGHIAFYCVHAANYVYEFLLEIIIGGETLPTVGYRWQFFDFLVRHMKLKNTFWGLIICFVVTRNNNKFLIRQINSTHKLQLNIQIICLHIFRVTWFYYFPFCLCIFIVNFGQNIIARYAHYQSRLILVKSFLFSVLAHQKFDWQPIKIKWQYSLIELPTQKLKLMTVYFFKHRQDFEPYVNRLI